MKRFESVVDPFLPGEPAAARVPMRMLVFASKRSFREYFGSANFVGFLQPSLTASTVVIAPHVGNRMIQATALHEYSHYLLSNRLDVSLPLWLNEGLASLLGAMSFADDHAVLGELPASELRELTNRPRNERLSLKKVLATDYLFDFSNRDFFDFYVWSSLLAHYLYLSGEEASAALAGFLDDRSGSLTDHLGTSPRALERRLERYAGRALPTLRIDAPPAPAIALERRCLSSLEQDLAIGTAIVDHNPERALHLVDAHADAAGTDVQLLMLASRARAELEENDQALELAQQAHHLAPTDARTLVNLADQLTRRCHLRLDDECRAGWREAAPLYRQALELDRQRYDAVFGLGLSYLHSGRSGEAINYLRVAYGRAPWAVHVNFYLGEAYRIIGDTRARTYLTNARNWSQSSLWRQLAEAALDELEAQTR